LIRALRARAGLTQQELAVAAGTSQSTVAAYESGTKSPTLRTVENLAGSLGMEMVAEFIPRMTREDRRSLAFHLAIAELVRRDPKPVISRSRQNLTKLNEIHPHAGALFDKWREWLELPPEQLVSRLLDLDPEARDMRQVSPFSGILTTRDRARILGQFRLEEGT